MIRHQTVLLFQLPAKLPGISPATMRQVIKDRYIESVKASFLMLPSYRRFPGDDEFIRQIQIRNPYKFNRRFLLATSL